jgi:hypothetical protein
VEQGNKNKSLTAWLSLLGGPFGLHRMYLHGSFDWLAWLLQIPTGLAWWGFMRADKYGADDKLSWALIPLAGLTLAFCCGQGIYYGLMKYEQWNARYNSKGPANAPAGHSTWLSVTAVVLCLLVGAGALMASFVYCLQRFYQFRN